MDHRLVRDRYIDRLTHQAAALYLFLVTVADARGLSYYSDSSITQRLSVDGDTLESARKELVEVDLIAYKNPIYQVLALDRHRQMTASTKTRSPGYPESLGKIFKHITEAAS